MRAAPTTAPGDRIAGLDLWRALLMTGGLFVHGSIWLDARPLFAWVTYLSSGTRMGAFFAVAGFLAGRGLARGSARAWGERRLAQLLPPTVFGLVVICPAIALLQAAGAGDPSGLVTAATRLHHLWFLVALCLYTLLAVAVAPRLDALGLAGPRRTATALTTTAAAGLLLAGAVLLVVPDDAAGREALAVWRERRMIVHAPVFLMGLALARSPAAPWTRPGSAILPLAVLIVTFTWPWIVGDAVAGAIGRQGMSDLDDAVRLAVSPPAAALLVLRAAASVRRVPALARRIAAASLTTYLLHLPLILAVHLLVGGRGLDPHAQYALAIATSGIVAYHLHHRVVARSRWLRFLVNGRPLAATSMPPARSPA